MMNKIICWFKGHDWNIKTSNVCQEKTCMRCSEHWEGVTWEHVDLSELPYYNLAQSRMITPSKPTHK